MAGHVYGEGAAFKSIEDIAGKRVTIMGLGLNGGGEASARFFLRHGARVVVTDMKTERELRPSIDSIARDESLDLSRVSYHLGGHKIEDFTGADCVIKNPGVKYEDNEFLARAKSIESDVSVFLALSKSPVIAVTGSKGKSSTVSAISWGLSQNGVKNFLGGNITVSPLSFLEDTSENSFVTLELSSWQLSDLRGRKLLKPKISVITKIVPDHQNWYDGMEDYVADKKLVYADQDSSCHSIFDADGDEPGTGPKGGGTWGDEFARESKAQVLRYSEKTLPPNLFGAYQTAGEDGKPRGVLRLRGRKKETILRSLAVPGRHIRTNVLNAALVMSLLGVDARSCRETLAKWPGIPHRLQYFHEWPSGASRVKFYNDSCATVPEAAAAAAQSFGRPVILIAGGTDKGLPQEPLADSLASARGEIPARAVYLLDGSATRKLIPLLAARAVKYRGPFETLASLLEKLRADFSAGLARDDESPAVVFSPGATSFGMFRNEFARGDEYMKAVEEIFAV